MHVCISGHLKAFDCVRALVDGTAAPGTSNTVFVDGPAGTGKTLDFVMMMVLRQVENLRARAKILVYIYMYIYITGKNTQTQK